MALREFLERLQNDRKYKFGKGSAFETEECKAQYPWQHWSFPTCNLVHEHAVLVPRKGPKTNVVRRKTTNEIQKPSLINSGDWRHVWALTGPLATDDPPIIFKAMQRDFAESERNLDRHRRDALIMKRLTNNPMTLNIYGYCGHAGLFEYAPGGNLDENIRRARHKNGTWSLSPVDRLALGVQAAMGLAALHNFDQESRPSVAHGDLDSMQYVRVRSGLYVLNDFNRARLLRTNVTLSNNTSRQNDSDVCTYHIGNNYGKNRSPEEYAYQDQTEKVDVFSLGNIFNQLLTGRRVFRGLKAKDAIRKIKQGERPPLPVDIQKSNNPVDVALRTAMEMCFVHDPLRRASARSMEKYLQARLQELDPGRMKQIISTDHFNK